MRKGFISLIDFDGTIIFNDRYKDRRERNSIIQGWRNRVGKKMDRMYLQVAPNEKLSRRKPRN